MLVIEHLQLGGTERQLHNLALGLKRSGIGVEVCCFRSLGPFGESLRRHGVVVHLVPKRSKVDVTLPFRLAALFRRRRPDVVHLFLFTASLWGGLAARLAQVPAVVSTERNVNHLELRDHPAEVILFRLAVRLFHDRVLGNSDRVTRYLGTALKIPPRRVGTVYNGLDTSTILPRRTREEVRRELGVAKDGQILLMVARLTRQKNYPLFLQGAARLLREFPRLVVVVAGAGSLEHELRSLARSLGIAEATRFLGPRQDVADLMAASDVVALTSDWEGFPNTLLEAMWSGRPVVATDVGGCGEVVEDGKTGYLVPPGDEVAFAGATRRLLNEPDLAAQMGAAGHRRVAERFTARRLVEGTLDQYQIALNVEAQPALIEEGGALGG
jgi:glycosyltransferase involved in cell wall biosynthesis